MPTLNVPMRNYILDQMNGAFDEGKFRIYSGTKPATPNLAPTGTLLVEVTAEDFFAAASGGEIEINESLLDESANGAGTAGWARLSQAGDNDTLDGAYRRMDFTVTGTGGGGEITLDNPVIAAGQRVEITSMKLVQPAGS